MNIELEINGFKYTAVFTEKEINEIYEPLLEKLSKIQKEKKERIIVFMAAPPAVGKSTLATFLEKLSKENENYTEIQNLSLDGFHFPNDYLKSNEITKNGETVPLYKIKGMPETFDLNNFEKYLKDLKTKNIKWPIYDRNLHNPVMDVISVESDIILIEGNWLLLDENGWREVKKYCDYSIFVEASEESLKDRLVNRKIKGGLSREEALEFYERTDGKNIHRVLENRLDSDLTLKMLNTGEKIIKD